MGLCVVLFSLSLVVMGNRKTQETMDMLNRFGQTLRAIPSSGTLSTKPVPQDQPEEVMDEDQPIKDETIV